MKIAKLLLPCLLVFALSASAQADCGGLGLAYQFGYGGFQNNYAPRTVNNTSMPYFSLHPPVYYGQRYTRPYGASPFAAWPQLQGSSTYAPTPHVDRSVTFANPYATVGAVVQPQRSPEPVQPLVIENPFFNDGDIRYTAKQ